jgi:hypothetical protein|tara:strand:+ start:278 stop:439 length:162 start_codon:yes stop_codon:yes gene_type:complete
MGIETFSQSSGPRTPFEKCAGEFDTTEGLSQAGTERWDMRNSETPEIILGFSP